MELLLEVSVERKGKAMWERQAARSCRGKSHPLLERNHERASGYEDKATSCEGLSDTLEEESEWERPEAGGQHGGLDLSRREMMVASTGEGMGNRAGPFPKPLPASTASSGGLPGDSDCESDVEPRDQ